jgi:hypothetical protein
MAVWLLASGIRIVVLEADGEFWIPVYEDMEAYGIEVMLVNVRGKFVTTLFS